MFLRMFVIERLLRFTNLAFCDVVRLSLLLIMCTIILRCQELKFRATMQLLREKRENGEDRRQGIFPWVWTLVLGRRPGECIYF
jgi:hypothetical protein